MKKIITAIFLVITLFTYGQNNVRKQIDEFNTSVLNMLKKVYDNKLEIYDLDNYNIRVIPSFYAYIDEKNKEHYELNTKRWNLVGISKSSKDTIIFTLDNERITRSTWTEPQFEFIILNKSDYCFYLYFLKKESYYSNIMGYIEKEKIVIEDFTFSYYKNLTEAIKYYCGSIEKVKDIENVEKFKEDFSKNTTVEQAKNILRNSYTDCYRLYPKDTLLVLSTYLNQLDATIHLFEGQKDFLKRLIQKNIKIKDRETIMYPEFEYFMNNFISWDLLTTLTNDQYYDFKKNNFYFKKKVELSRDILRNYFINQQKNPPEQFDEILRKEVFNK